MPSDLSEPQSLKHRGMMGVLSVIGTLCLDVNRERWDTTECLFMHPYVILESNEKFNECGTVFF